MPNQSASRFEFIGHALRGDGPFRPIVRDDGMGTATLSGYSYLTRYPRESEEKFARRNELAFYASPLAQSCSRFVGYVTTKPVTRDLPHQLYEVMAEDIDGKGNDIEVFWQQFMSEAKARGSMLLLVDMPAAMSPSLGAQLQSRVAPYWTAILPEIITDYQIGDDGKFLFAEFAGNFTQEDKKRIPCTWRFDVDTWSAFDKEKRVLGSGDHRLGECPLLIWTESGDFPNFGPFAAIADLSKRLFNLDSELDEILRAQTFSLLTMQVPDNSTDAQKLAAAQVVGETIGTANLMVHSGSAPTFIAPPDGPATVYLSRIDKLRDQVNEIGLNVATVNQQESGIAMQMRFQSINAELARFSIRMEDLENRSWELSRRWLGMTSLPHSEWPRDFNIADVLGELQILAEMQSTAMPPEVITAQQRRIVNVQFGALEREDLDDLNSAVDDTTRGIDVESNVVSLPADRNAEMRTAIVRALNG